MLQDTSITAYDGAVAITALQMADNKTPNAKILNGDGLRFYPKDLISRGDAAVLVCNCENVIEGGSEK